MPAATRRASRAFPLILAILATSSVGLAEDPTTEPGPEPEPTTYRDGFEGPRPAWRQEETDATFLLRVHDRSEANAHEGRLAERFLFEAGAGSVLYYSYDVPRTPIVANLKATLYARSNRPGVQLFGVVILPDDQDPERGAPTMVMVTGTSLDTAERWQRLELSGLAAKVEEQARVIRVATGRPVSLKGAYLERLVVNLYGGGGDSEVLLDELTLSPVPPDAQVVDREPAEAPDEEAADPAAADPTARVKMVGTRLTNNGADWFPFIVSAPGADIEMLRRANFDVLAVDPEDNPETLARAVEQGFLLMPQLNPAGAFDAERAGSRARAFDFREAVAFWGLGMRLGAIADPSARESELEGVRGLIETVHDLPKGGSRLTTGTVAGLFPQYGLFGNNLDLMGVEVDAVGRMEDPMDTYRYLSQRRDLTATANPNGLFLAWVPTRTPEAIRAAVWGVDVPPDWGWPQVLPEQMRLYAYAAISAGYRGLGFRGDAGFSHASGLARLYEASLLIGELSLVEPILARSTGQVTQWDAFPPDPKIKLNYDASGGTSGGYNNFGANPGSNQKPPAEVQALGSVKVTIIETDDTRTKLLIVTDFADGAQWQPPQMASREVNLLVPAPESAQAFEITLGGVKNRECRRDVGGKRIVLPTFNTTALVLLTTDLNLIGPIQRQAAALSPRAADIAIKQAELELREVETIHAKLVAQGQTVRDADSLLDQARRILQSGREALDRQDFELAWSEARTVGQPLRMIRRAQWERAFGDLAKANAALARTDGPTPIRDAEGKLKRPPQLISPVACAPLLSWRTLPQYYYWRDWIRGEFGPFGANRLPSGQFDGDPSALREAGWVDASHDSPDIRSTISIDREEGWGPQEDHTSLKLRVEPRVAIRREDFRQPDGGFDKASEAAYRKALTAAIDVLPPYRDHLEAAVRSPSVPVHATNFVRIRVLAKMPRELAPGRGGLIVRDSLGGEALQFRTTKAIAEWKEIVLYRRAPTDGEVSVTLGLAGYGEAFFDDLRIDILGDTTSPVPEPASSLARRVEDGPTSRPAESTETPRR